jgi:hypothetical protein
MSVNGTGHCEWLCTTQKPGYFETVQNMIGWAERVASMGKRTRVYRILVEKPEGERPLGRSKDMWEDNIKMDLKEVG